MSSRSSGAVVVVAVLSAVVLGAWAWIFAGFGSSTPTQTGTLPETAQTSSTTVTKGASGKSWTMSDAKSAVAGDDSVVLVLGDSTGNDRGEWVDLWATARLNTTAALWRGDDNGGEYLEEGDDTRVWSGSQAGSRATYPIEHWSDIWSEKTPDVVIINFGQNYKTPEPAVRDLSELRDRVAKRAPKAPIVVMLQNPQQGDANAETREGIAAWAKGEGLPTIDVAAAFEKDGRGDALRRDAVHPSDEGSQVWADAVSAQLP